MGSKDSIRVLPVTCDRCESGPVQALRRGERVVIRCVRCGAEVFAYEDPAVREADTPSKPPTDETVTLAQVGPRARQLYDTICAYISRNGYAPSIDEMRQALRLRSASTVCYHLEKLVKAGLIERDYAVSRGIRVARRAA